MPGGWGPGAWTPSGGQEPSSGGNGGYSGGNGSGSGSGNGSGSGSGDGGGGVMDLSWAQSTPELEADIAASTFSQPTETFSGTGGGPEWSDTNPYFTSPYGLPDAQFGSNVVPEQKPITNPSDMMIGNLLAYELSKDPKYKKEFVGPGSPPTNTLGKIMAVDSKGQMILDSSGNPIFTGFGKKMVDEFQANWDPSNPMDITLPGVFKEMAGDVIGKEKDYFKNIGSTTQGGGGYGYGYGGGGGGGGGGYGGYGYGPAGGPKPQEMAGFYTPQANLQQAMIGQHMRKSRGGIVSLLGLRS